MRNLKTIGILGGMGPMATYDLALKILEHTDAECDQDNIPVLIDCNTRIPDRTAAIIDKGEDPLPELIRSAVRLEAAGADFLIMPCNTAHYYYDEVCAAVNIPMLHMLRETASYLSARGIRRAGVLATDGTCMSGIYDRILSEYDIGSVYPAGEHQRVVMSLVYDYIKAGRQDYGILDLDGVMRELCSRGAEIVILGCTELPLAQGVWDSSILRTIDPADILAGAAVTAAGGSLRGGTA